MTKFSVTLEHRETCQRFGLILMAYEWGTAYEVAEKLCEKLDCYVVEVERDAP